MKLFKNYVLVEQTMTSKESKIILTASKDESEKFDYTSKVVDKGPNCTLPLEVGDQPIFSQHALFQGMKVIEKTKKKMVTHVIVHEDDIIAVDNEQI